MIEHCPVGGIEIAYAEQGQGDTTVFLLHGVTANHRVWAPIASALAAHVRVIAVDQRGHGHSSKPETGYTAEDFAGDIRGLVETLGGAGKNILVGHSLGSRNSIAAAAMFPGLVDGIVGIDFTPFIEVEVFDSLESRVGAGAQAFESVDAIEAYLQARYVNMPRDAVERRADYGYRLTDDGFVPLASPSAMLQIVHGLRSDLTGYYRDIATPAVIVRGAESILVTEAAFETSRECRPDLQYEVVANADHYVPEEQPEAITRIVLDFLHHTSSPPNRRRTP
ncbi:alpha/beta fold hydrolase [Glaciibacter superstes]|uniref:alpha/beta fold hydrolase n=1 Tax=Glaciibacter superstes TaxID=501023 RepID=UPI0003B719DD|nr:alpha/beta hydrolase [Glaciibacter superstes]